MGETLTDEESKTCGELFDAWQAACNMTGDMGYCGFRAAFALFIKAGCRPHPDNLKLALRELVEMTKCRSK